MIRAKIRETMTKAELRAALAAFNVSLPSKATLGDLNAALTAAQDLAERLAAFAQQREAGREDARLRDREARKNSRRAATRRRKAARHLASEAAKAATHKARLHLLAEAEKLAEAIRRTGGRLAA